MIEKSPVIYQTSPYSISRAIILSQKPYILSKKPVFYLDEPYTLALHSPIFPPQCARICVAWSVHKRDMTHLFSRHHMHNDRDNSGVLRDSCMNVTWLTCFPATICAIAVTQLATTRGSVSNLSSISLHMSCHMYDIRRSSVKQSWLSSWLVYIHIARLVCTCHVTCII